MDGSAPTMPRPPRSMRRPSRGYQPFHSLSARDLRIAAGHPTHRASSPFSLNRIALRNSIRRYRGEAGGTWGLWFLMLENVGLWRIRSQLLVNAFDLLRAMGALQPADDEMAFAHILEMRDEQGVDHRAADSAQNGNGLRGRFLRYDDGEARCNHGDQADHGRSPFLRKAAPGQMLERVGNGFRHRRPRSEIARLAAVIAVRGSAQRQYLNAFKPRLGRLQIFALAAGDVRDRPQHDRCGYREFNRQRRQTE